MSDERNTVDKATAWDAISEKNAEIASLRERVAEMQYEAGMYQSLYEVSKAKLESARKALENEREFWAGKVASAMIRKLPSDDAQDHVDRITAALTDETGK